MSLRRTSNWPRGRSGEQGFDGVFDGILLLDERLAASGVDRLFRMVTTSRKKPGAILLVQSLSTSSSWCVVISASGSRLTGESRPSRFVSYRSVTGGVTPPHQVTSNCCNGRRWCVPHRCAHPGR